MFIDHENSCIPLQRKFRDDYLVGKRGKGLIWKLSLHKTERMLIVHIKEWEGG